MLKKLMVTVLMMIIFAGLLPAQETTGNTCVLYDMDGKEVRLSDYRGKPLIICFWTTWCPYCRREMQKLNKVYTELHSTGIELLAINVAERQPKVARFLRSYPVDFKVLLDKDGECAFSYGIIGIPTYLLINRQGMVKMETGSFPADKYKELLLD